MALWLLATVFDALRPADYGRADVHFHNGAEGRPAVCYDERCGRPRLTID